MSRRPRRNHSASFKAKVALAAIKGEKTLSPARYISINTCASPKFNPGTKQTRFSTSLVVRREMLA
jgi:hypothetical protein